MSMGASEGIMPGSDALRAARAAAQEADRAPTRSEETSADRLSVRQSLLAIAEMMAAQQERENEERASDRRRRLAVLNEIVPHGGVE
jgi:hypothetical protein